MPTRKSKNTVYQRIAGILIVVVVITSLPGCLVKKKDLDKIARTTDNLRIYQDGDYIIYDVIAVRLPNNSPTPETLYGTLRIDWNAHQNLIQPVTNNSIPVIQEIMTLNLNGASETGTVRYISQDTNGKVTLHAIEATGIEEHYWLNTQGNNNLTTTEFFTIFNSPITFGDQDFDSYNPKTDITTTNSSVSFYILEGCEGQASCNSSIGQFSDDHDVVGDSTEITTNLGVFVNPFRIDFYGSATPTPAPFPVVFDIRDVCGTGPTQHGFASNGIMYIMPEVGMIYMSNTCYDAGTGDVMQYTYTLSNTNISLP